VTIRSREWSSPYSLNNSATGMTRLELDALCLSHGGVRLTGLSARLEGRSVALVGASAPILALLAGRCEVVSGSFSIDGLSAREAVIAGHVGVADPELSPLPKRSVSEWLATALMVRGKRSAQANSLARETLRRLNLEYLGVYAAERLNAPTLWAARVALALTTEPTCVVLPPPTWTAEAMAFERAVLWAAQSAAAVVLACDPARQPELFLASEQALLIESKQARVLEPHQYYGPGTQGYSLLPLANRAGLVRALERGGTPVVNPGGEGEIWVRVSGQAGSAALVRAAVEANAPLLRMTRLSEIPG
jgi:ABC-type taurine transport system ATPase subunit